MENDTDILITRVSEIKSKLSHHVESSFRGEAFEKLITEGGEGFYNYVDKVGLANDSNLIVLSSRHNYYYDAEEMKSVKTVIHLRELNRIKELTGLTGLLNTHLNSLPLGCNFVGCFINNNKIERYALRSGMQSNEDLMNTEAVELGLVSRFPFINMLYSMLDSKTNSFMSVKGVTLLLSLNGFKVLNMTEINGITFFHSKKVSNIYN